MIVKAYISGALTGIDHLPGLKKFYEDLAEVCGSHSITAYVPHLQTDPKNSPQISPQDIYAIDRKQVCESNLVIAYVGFPSLGVGQEIEIARENDIPVLLLMECDAVVSRMARGNTAVVAEIRFTDYQDALNQLSQWLKDWRI